MSNDLRQDVEEVKNAVEVLNVVANVERPGLSGKINFNKNILADYTAAFSADFLQQNVLTLIVDELLEEILIEMRKDRRTARLADGLQGKIISEKRSGVWAKVPRPKIQVLKGQGSRTPIFGGEKSPIRIESFVQNGQVTLTVQLQSALYIVMHSGARPHNVPPINVFHVFPTKELLTQFAGQYPNAKYSKYGKDFFNLRSVPWRAKGGPRTSVEFERDAKGNWRRRLRPVRLKGITKMIPSPGFGPAVPFVTVAWRRVIRRNRDRTMATITRRIAGRGMSGGLGGKLPP